MERDERIIAGLQLASARLVIILLLLLIVWRLGKPADPKYHKTLFDNNLYDLVDPQKADEFSLARLPGIGPAKAKRIVDYHSQRPIKTIDDLDAISGFGPKTMEKIHNYLYFNELP